MGWSSVNRVDVAMLTLDGVVALQDNVLYTPEDSLVLHWEVLFTLDIGLLVYPK